MVLATLIPAFLSSMVYASELATHLRILLDRFLLGVVVDLLVVAGHPSSAVATLPPRWRAGRPGPAERRHSGGRLWQCSGSLQVQAGGETETSWATHSDDSHSWGLGGQREMMVFEPEWPCPPR